MPHAALVHDNFTGPTGMGLILGRHANWLMAAGWSVTLVGENIPHELATACEVVRVTAPRQLPSLPEHLGWCARARRALRRVNADIVHAHSPLLDEEADIVTSHFMAHPSHMRGARELGTGAGGVLRRLQAAVTRRIDHRAYGRLARGSAYLSFVSEFLRDEFATWYGDPRGGWVFAPPAPAWRPVGGEERLAAREHFGLPEGTLCVGYVGGSDPRKGYTRLGELASASDITLLFAGPGSERIRLAGRYGIGFVDIDELYAACDVVAAPAVFDSAPVAVLQAIARDLPVVTTRRSGWAAAIERNKAGVVVEGGGALPAAAREAAAQTSTEGRRRLLAEFSEERQQETLLAAYSQVLESHN